MNSFNRTPDNDQEQASKGPSRFMGSENEYALRKVDPKEPEKGLIAHTNIWIHIKPTSQNLFLVADLGVGDGVEFNSLMRIDLERGGICEEVAYHASYDQYWKMPTQEAILRMPSLYNIEMPPLLSRVKLTTQLVRKGEPTGYWIRVVIGDLPPLPPKEEPSKAGTRAGV